MTVSPSYRIGDLMDVRVSGGITDFADLATGQIVALGALDRHRVATICPVGATAFFTREESLSWGTDSDVQTWHVPAML